MCGNKEKNLVTEEFRQIVKDAARQMGQPLSAAAEKLAAMVKKGEVEIIICAESEAIITLTNLSKEYKLTQDLPKSFLCDEEDSLSSIWLCLSCGSELYAPSIRDYCPACFNKMPSAI